jgi:hypothetical protein
MSQYQSTRKLYTQESLRLLPPDHSFTNPWIVNFYLIPYYLLLRKSGSMHGIAQYVFQSLIGGNLVDPILPSGLSVHSLKEIPVRVFLEKAENFLGKLTANHSDLIANYVPQTDIIRVSPGRPRLYQDESYLINFCLCPISRTLSSCSLLAQPGETYPTYYIEHFLSLGHPSHRKWAFYSDEHPILMPLKLPAETLFFDTRADAIHALKDHLKSLGLLDKVARAQHNT